MKITHNDKEIIFTFPRYQKRYNPYMEEESELGEYPNFTGLIVRHRKAGHWDEIGFAGTIDMSYKDKGDQASDIIVSWHGSEEDFRKKCAELKINIHELEH